MDKLTAINQVLQVWGVSEKDRIEAIQFITQGADCQKVVQAIVDMQNALGALEALRPKAKA
ncbi:MAG: hypothetical protein NTU76_01755 [Candidatus Taylorbacteria bacterium]|nr:hypothetical protein [Candidatus Taylorbacteria bacterium]